MPFCSNCGAGPSDEPFCAKCGARLAPAPAPAAPAAVPFTTATVPPAPVAAPPAPSRRPRRRLVWIVGTVVLVVASAATAFVLVTGGGGPESRLTSALRHVPADADMVNFVDWTSIGHPAIQALPKNLVSGGEWIASSTLISQQLGVQPTQSTWEVDYFTGDENCAVIRWPDAQGPRSIAAGLVRGGWQQTTNGSQLTLTRSAPPDGDQWQWAYIAYNFVVDTSADTVTQCRSEQQAHWSASGGDSFADISGIGDLVISEGSVNSASYESYRGACRSAQAAVPFTVVGVTGRADDPSLLTIGASYATSADAGGQKDAFTARVVADPQHRNPPGPTPKLTVSSVAVHGQAVVDTLNRQQPWGQMDALTLTSIMDGSC